MNRLTIRSGFVESRAEGSRFVGWQLCLMFNGRLPG
jgi:hypothetical protein